MTSRAAAPAPPRRPCVRKILEHGLVLVQDQSIVVDDGDSRSDLFSESAIASFFCSDRRQYPRLEPGAATARPEVPFTPMTLDAQATAELLGYANVPSTGPTLCFADPPLVVKRVPARVR